MASFRTLCLASIAVVVGGVPSAAQLSIAGNQLWRQGAAGILDVSDEGDRFGQALAAGDFNGDGWDDLAIGALGENDSRGIVNVIYGSHGGLTSGGNQLWEQGVGGIDGNAEPNDRFGVAVASGDLNGDGYGDLIIGASGEDGSRGVVHAIYGSADGLAAQGNQAWRQGDNGIGDRAEGDDAFGFSLAVGDFNADGFDDVAVGAPSEDSSRGLVVMIFGSAGGLISDGHQRWREGEDELQGNGESGDLFGYELAAGDFNGDGFDDLAAGTPGEDSTRGAVHIIYGAGGGLTAAGNVRLQEGERGTPGTARDGNGFGEVIAAGDFNSNGYDDLAISALGHAVGRGQVTVVPGSAGGPRGAAGFRWVQSFLGRPSEAGNRFGSALAAGDFNADGVVDLAIGVRGEDGNRGVVHTLHGSGDGLIPHSGQGPQVFAQGADGLLDSAEESDDFGFMLAAGNFGADPAADLAVGAPGEDNSGGVVHVLFGASSVPFPVVSAVVGGGLSNPPIAAASYNSIVSVFGENFVATSAGVLPPGTTQQGAATIMNGVCVEMSGRRVPLFAVTPRQINLQAALVPETDAVRIEVVVNCGQPNALRSAPFDLPIAPATPEFFFFLFNPDGVNPIAAVHEPSGVLVGAPDLISGTTFEPARPGDVVTVYLTGLGATTPLWEPGQFPAGPSTADLPVSITIGGMDVEVLYAGVTPGFFGLYQASFGIPSDAQAGDLPVRITAGEAATPAGGFLTVAR